MDLNHRPLGYEPNELPDCSTPHKNHISAVVEGQTQLTRSPLWGRQNSYGFPISGLLHAAVFNPGDALYRFSFFLSHASTIFVGSMAALSNCSSRIFPSLPIRKLIRRAALYLSTYTPY